MKPAAKTKRVSPPKTPRRAAPLRDGEGPDCLDHLAVAKRAFVLFLERGARHGHDVEDWLQAEREIRSEGATVVSAPDVPVRRSRRTGSTRATPR